MANHKSAEKRILTAERNRLRNQAVKSAFRSAIKKVRNNVEKKLPATDLEKDIKLVYSLLDKAVLKGVLHKNTAARYKSGVKQLLNKAS